MEVGSRTTSAIRAARLCPTSLLNNPHLFPLSQLLLLGRGGDVKPLRLDLGNKRLLFSGPRGFEMLWPEAVKHFGVLSGNPLRKPKLWAKVQDEAAGGSSQQLPAHLSHEALQEDASSPTAVGSGTDSGTSSYCPSSPQQQPFEAPFPPLHVHPPRKLVQSYPESTKCPAQSMAEGTTLARPAWSHRTPRASPFERARGWEKEHRRQSWLKGKSLSNTVRVSQTL